MSQDLNHKIQARNHFQEEILFHIKEHENNLEEFIEGSTEIDDVTKVIDLILACQMRIPYIDSYMKILKKIDSKSKLVHNLLLHSSDERGYDPSIIFSAIREGILNPNEITENTLAKDLLKRTASYEKKFQFQSDLAEIIASDNVESFAKEKWFPIHNINNFFGFNIISPLDYALLCNSQRCVKFILDNEQKQKSDFDEAPQKDKDQISQEVRKHIEYAILGGLKDDEILNRIKTLDNSSEPNFSILIKAHYNQEVIRRLGQNTPQTSYFFDAQGSYNLEIMKFILDNPNFKLPRNHNSRLFMDLVMIELINTKKKLNIKDYPFKLFIEEGQFSFFIKSLETFLTDETLINSPLNEMNETFLHLAATNNDIESIKICLDHGANPNVKTKFI